MHKMSHPFHSILLLALALSTPAGAQIVNGDFEDPELSGNQWYKTVDKGETTLVGWGVDGTSIDIVSTHTGKNNFANTFTQGIDMAGSPGPGTIFQNVSTLPGQTYQLTFFTSSNGGPKPGGLTVRWRGADLATINGSDGSLPWVANTFTVTASSTSTLLEFVGNLVPGEDPRNGVLLDSVELEALCPFVIPVVNGELEEPKVVGSSAAPAQAGMIPGWTVDAVTSQQGVDVISGGGSFTSQVINLSGTIGPGSISQELPTTPLATYRVSFKMSAQAAPIVPAMHVEWDGVTFPVHATGKVGTWQKVSLSLPASSGNTTVLKLVGGRRSVFVDSIRVTELCP